MNRLNDMVHVLKQWIKTKLSSNSQNWLEHRVSNENPKTNLKPLASFFFFLKLTNWSSHKLENSLEWSIISNQQANFINFNPIEQNPQIGFKTNPRIFNCSQNPKLIKLTNIYHEYINIEAKSNDQFQKKRVDSTKIPNLKSFENSLKMYEIMHEIMKIKTIGGV